MNERGIHKRVSIEPKSGTYSIKTVAVATTEKTKKTRRKTATMFTNILTSLLLNFHCGSCGDGGAGDDDSDSGILKMIKPIK